MSVVGRFDDHRVNHRQIQAGRHPAIEETGVKHQAIVVDKILFVESPADTLDSTALNLAFDIAWVYCFACILKSGVPDEVHLTGLWMNLDVHDVKPKGFANPAGLAVTWPRIGPPMPFN
jgi:hypothetical protein